VNGCGSNAATVVTPQHRAAGAEDEREPVLVQQFEPERPGVELAGARGIRGREEGDRVVEHGGGIVRPA
jgi:hypothetical protein